MHYIATAGPGSAGPKDSDRDGIPDYVENASGTGTVGPKETDWQAAYTASGVYDPTNSLYDDIDLSGDGFVGRVKKALGMQPFDTGNPLTLTPTTSPGPNRVAFLAPIPFSTFAGIGCLSLRLDGRPVPFLRWDQDASGGCLLTWDTTYGLPGDHLAQVELYLNGQARPGAMGAMALVTLTAGDQPYQYPLVPGTPAWASATPDDHLASAAIPQSWQDTATSWQLFSSVIANPYFRVIWIIGTSISADYNAAKGQTLSALNAVEASPDFGTNSLRYLASLDLPTMTGADCSDATVPGCFLDYTMVCHMASLDASLNTLDESSLRKLFELAAWDASYFSTRLENIVATGPVRLMYAIYNKPGFPATLPPGATLPALSSDQSSELDLGHLPSELIAPVGTLTSALGLVERP
jgi:hypothetical protein